jgi:hypothetical protein
VNFLFGIIIGVVLTVGSAFIADSFATGDVQTDTTARQIVNWDVAKERLHDSTTSIRVGWNRLERGVDELIR